jgi:hypothetical protein
LKKEEVLNKLAMLALMAFLSVGAYAGGNNNGDGNCRGNCPSGGGGTQTSNQVQLQAQQQESSSVAKAKAKSQSDSASQAQSSSSSAGGAGGNVTFQEGSVTPTTNLTTGGTTLDLVQGDTNFSSNYEHDEAAATAASVYADVCQVGASGQVEEGGFSLISQNQFCLLVDHAKLMQAAAKEAEHKGDFKNYEKYNEAYHQALSDAMFLVDKSKATGFIGHVANQLGLPIALVAALVFLL